MSHDEVVEAAVVGVPHEKWQERPLALVAPADGAEPTETELLDHLASELNQTDWWLPDEVRTVETIPKTATGKFDKSVIRDRIDST